MKKFKDMKKKNKFYIIGIGVLLLCLIGLSTGIVFAKYVSQKDGDVPYSPPEFYFESDMLSSGSAPSYSLQRGVGAITFKLKNYADSLRFSETDIAYTVTLTKGGSTVKTSTGTIAGGAVRDASVELTELDAGTYTVTVTSTAPYVKTLSAIFVIAELDTSVTATVTDGGNTVELNISTKDFSGNVTIAYPDGLYPDNTDPLMESAGEDSHTVEFNTDSSRAFVFFKADPTKTYSATVSGATVTISES